MAQSFVGGDGKPAMILPNQLRMPPQTTALLQNDAQMIWFPAQQEGPAARMTALVNTCADYLTYSKALKSMHAWCPPDLAVFNHPAAIARAGSDQTMDRLRDIEGLNVPNTHFFRPRVPEDFATQCQNAGLDLPVTLHDATDRSGASMMLIAKPADWENVHRTNWPGKIFCLTQLDRDLVAQHTRYRICFVGQSAEVMRYQFSYGQNIMPSGIVKQRAVEPSMIKRICTDLMQQILLDFWTAEFSVTATGKLRLEHLWIGLPLPDQRDPRNPSDRMWPKIAPRLHALIQSPEKWRTAKRPSASKIH